MCMALWLDEMALTLIVRLLLQIAHDKVITPGIFTIAMHKILSRIFDSAVCLAEYYIKAAYFTIMHLSIVYPTTPSPGQCQGRSGDLSYAKFKCTTFWTCQSVKSQPSLHLKMGIYKGISLLIFTLLYMHMVSGQISHIQPEQVLVSNTPPFPLHSPGGEVGHNTYRCISLVQQHKLCSFRGH